MAVLVVDGLIGAGKSVLIERLAEMLSSPPYNKNVQIIPEPVEQWEHIGIFQEFCQDMKRWSYEFQTYVHSTRVHTCIKHFDKNPRADVYIMERSSFTDRYIFVEILRDQGNISEMQYEMYQRWWEVWNIVNPFKINGFIYLRPDLDICMDRMKKRNRKGETNISKEYQRQLLVKHDDFLQNEGFALSGHPSLILNENGNFKEDDELVKNILTKIIFRFGLFR